MKSKIDVSCVRSPFRTLRRSFSLQAFKKSYYLLFVILLLQAANGNAQTVEKSTLKTMSVKEAFEDITNRLGYSVWFKVEEVDLTKKVSISYENKTISELLDVILKGQSVSYEIKGKAIRIFKTTADPQKGKAHQVSGVVVDATDGTPLVGGSVRIKDKNTGTITDVDGKYLLNVTPGDVLIFSYMGYNPIELQAGDDSVLDIMLSAEGNVLNDVVITGYQILKKFNVTGSINTLSADKIELRSTNSLQGVLEGSIPGLTVYNNEFRIRGGASINSGNKPLFIVDDFEAEGLPENMDIVESITVLKDAAAAAIWGSRAANGVIVITTKKGKANDFRVSYSGNMKVNAFPNFNDLQRIGSEDMVDYERELFLKGYYKSTTFKRSNSGYSQAIDLIKEFLPATDNPSEITAEQLGEIDNRLALLAKNHNRKQIEDHLLRNGFQQQHMLSISGGDEKVNYFLSGNYMGGNSSYKGDKNQLFGINSRTSYRLYSFLTLRSDITAAFSSRNNGYGSLASGIYGLHPYQMLLDDNGNRVLDYSKFNHDFSRQMVSDYGYFDQGENLLDEVDLANNKTKGLNYKVRVGADFKVWEGLNLSADYQYEKAQSSTKVITDMNSYGGRNLLNSMAFPGKNGLDFLLPLGDILDQNNETIDAWIFKMGATLNRQFGPKKEHYVNAVAGFEMRSRHAYSDRYRKFGYDKQTLAWKPIDAVSLAKYRTWWNGTSKIYSSDGYDGFGDVVNRELSYFLSGVYTYDERYTGSVSLRIDESNLFGVSDKYRRNPIWSFGLNWNIKNEKFFNSEVISNLLLRGSLGLTGNFDRQGRTTPKMVGKIVYIPQVNEMVVRMNTPPNPKLRWERSRSANASVDLGLFDRIDLSMTYYDTYAYDLLGSTLLDPTNGYESAVINAADMINRGFEFTLAADIIRSKDFGWNVNWNFSYNYNKITKNNIQTSALSIGLPSGSTKFIEGVAREALWSYRWAGLDEAGEPMVYDKNNNKVYDVMEFDKDDLEYSGTYQPKYNGSLTTGFRYKNLQASLMFTYNFGHVFRTEYPTAGSSSYNKKIAKRWKSLGDEQKTDIAKIQETKDVGEHTWYRDNIVKYSSNSILKGDMIRLREIMLNYEVPTSILKNTPLKRLSLTAQFNNVCFWAANKEGIDPESINPLRGDLSLRQPFSFTAGLKVDF